MIIRINEVTITVHEAILILYFSKLSDKIIDKTTYQDLCKYMSPVKGL